MKSLFEILNFLDYQGSCPHDVRVSALKNHSQKIEPGDLFLAYPGHTADGRDYINHAIGSGAVACLVEADDVQSQAFYSVPVIKIPSLQKKVSELVSFFSDNPSSKLELVGITGTNGKSSCVHFFAQALEALGLQAGVLGTVGNGVWPILTSSSLTTLDAVGIDRHLQQFVSESIGRVAMEVSSHALSQSRVDHLQFKVAVFTSLSHEHLDYHGSLEEYAKAKFRLFQYPSVQYGVVNLDDEYGSRLVKERADIRWVGYSVNDAPVVQGCDLIRAYAIRQSKTGISFELEVMGERWSLALPLLGRFNIGNVLAIIGVLSVLDFSLDQIKKAVSQLVTVEGRMQIIDSHNKPTIVVDYAHTPDALEKALIAIGEHFPGNVFCVFGCGGDRDKDKRPLMAQVAERYASKVVVTSDNSRSESLQQIWSEIQCGFSNVDNVTKIADRGQAIAFAVQSAGIDDIVFLAGMGHEFVVTDASQSYPMKDLDIAQQALLQYGL